MTGRRPRGRDITAVDTLSLQAFDEVLDTFRWFILVDSLSHSCSGLPVYDFPLCFGCIPEFDNIPEFSKTVVIVRSKSQSTRELAEAARMEKAEDCFISVLCRCGSSFTNKAVVSVCASLPLAIVRVVCDFPCKLEVFITKLATTAISRKSALVLCALPHPSSKMGAVHASAPTTGTKQNCDNRSCKVYSL